MKPELRTCESCGRTFLVRPEVIKSEKKLHIQVKICDKCQRKDYYKNND